MASSSASQNRPNLNMVPQPEVWQPNFLNSRNQPITVDDSVIYNFANATAVAAKLITPRDERILSERSDMDVMRDSMALSAQAVSVTSNMARRFHARTMEVQGLRDQVLNLQQLLAGSHRRMRILRAENRELKRLVDSYARGLEPRVVELAGLEDQIRGQLERLLDRVEREPSVASPNPSPSQNATIE